LHKPPTGFAIIEKGRKDSIPAPFKGVVKDVANGVVKDVARAAFKGVAKGAVKGLV
jgi:hypothetical protein